MDSKDEPIPSFFCIPDITGFTKLIATADINFSKDVIPGLLRKLIDCNILDLNIGEIEGDAIFFYRTGRLPSVKQVVKQCKLFYKAFCDYIKLFGESHPKEYKEFLSDDLIGLKIVIHYGKILTTNIKGRVKLIGPDVIIAHKLLKNAVPESEYILLTDSYLKKIRGGNLESWFNWDLLEEGKESYEYIGDVNYKYIRLERVN